MLGRNILFIIILACISSCTMFTDWVISEEINTIEEAHYFMMGYQYQKDIGDNWQTPEATYYKGYGDCEDFAGLLAHIFIYCLNYKNVRLSIGYIDSGERHMTVKYNGYYYNGNNVYPINEAFRESYSISYETYLFLSEIR